MGPYTHMRLDDTFIPHPIPEAPARFFAHHARGSTIWIRSHDTLAAFDIARCGPLWTVPCPIDDGPDQNRVSFAMINESASLWASSDGSVVAALRWCGSGVAILAFAAASGELLWERALADPTIPAADESTPDNTTWVMFAPTADAMILAVVRGALAGAPGNGRLIRFDASSGGVAWERELPEPLVLAGYETVLSFHVRNDELRAVDFTTGTIRTLAGPFPGAEPAPCRGSDGIYVSCHDRRGSVTVARIHPETGERLAECTWRRPKVKETRIHESGGTVVLHINHAAAVLLDDTLAPRWESEARPYIYGVAALPAGPVLIATNGHGGALLAFDRSSGRQILLTKPPRGGVDPPVLIEGTEVFAASLARGLHCVHGRTLDRATADLSGHATIIGTHAGRLAAFAHDRRRQGVHILAPA